MNSITFFLLLCFARSIDCFSVQHSSSSRTRGNSIGIKKAASVSSTMHTIMNMANDDGVVELADDEEDIATPAKSGSESAPAPAMFLSQGEISDEAIEEALNPDLSDPKQTRVIIYIVLSLIPVLFLIPLMLGSRDLIPLEALPPVQM